jgi:hypothetical protein
MKLLAILAAATVALGAVRAHAQGPISGSRSSVISSMFFVQVGAGAGAHDNGPFSRRLQSYIPYVGNENLLYQTEPISQVGYSVGGALGYVTGSMLFGASGERLMFPTIESITSPGNERDKYVLAAWEAGADLGYLVVDEDATIVYPFLHAGYGRYSLEYTNNQTDSIPFFEGDRIAPGSTATYTGGAPRVGVGIGINSLVGGSAVLIGARLAYGRLLGDPEWEQDGTVVNNGGHTPCYNALTLSLSIGFGIADMMGFE